LGQTRQRGKHLIKAWALAAAIRGEEASDGITEFEELGFLLLAEWMESTQLIAEAHTATK
jgi:hypothetical protein